MGASRCYLVVDSIESLAKVEVSSPNVRLVRFSDYISDPEEVAIKVLDSFTAVSGVSYRFEGSNASGVGNSSCSSCSSNSSAILPALFMNSTTISNSSTLGISGVELVSDVSLMGGNLTIESSHITQHEHGISVGAGAAMTTIGAVQIDANITLVDNQSTFQVVENGSCVIGGSILNRGTIESYGRLVVDNVGKKSYDTAEITAAIQSYSSRSSPAASPTRGALINRPGASLELSTDSMIVSDVQFMEHTAEFKPGSDVGILGDLTVCGVSCATPTNTPTMAPTKEAPPVRVDPGASLGRDQPLTFRIRFLVSCAASSARLSSLSGHLAVGGRVTLHGAALHVDVRVEFGADCPTEPAARIAALQTARRLAGAEDTTHMELPVVESGTSVAVVGSSPTTSCYMGGVEMDCELGIMIYSLQPTDVFTRLYGVASSGSFSSGSFTLPVLMSLPSHPITTAPTAEVIGVDKAGFVRDSTAPITVTVTLVVRGGGATAVPEHELRAFAAALRDRNELTSAGAVSVQDVTTFSAASSGLILIKVGVNVHTSEEANAVVERIHNQIFDQVARQEFSSSYTIASPIPPTEYDVQVTGLVGNDSSGVDNDDTNNSIILGLGFQHLLMISSSVVVVLVAVSVLLVRRRNSLGSSSVRELSAISSTLSKLPLADPLPIPALSDPDSLISQKALNFYDICTPLPLIGDIKCDGRVKYAGSALDTVDQKRDIQLTAIKRLRTVNLPLLKRFFQSVSRGHNGLRVVTSPAAVIKPGKIFLRCNEKTDQSICEKATRPAILQEYPDFGMEHIRDALR